MADIQIGQSGVVVLRHVEMELKQRAVNVTTQRPQELMRKIVEV